jgi:hypothetical protein
MSCAKYQTLYNPLRASLEESRSHWLWGGASSRALRDQKCRFFRRHCNPVLAKVKASVQIWRILPLKSPLEPLLMQLYVYLLVDIYSEEFYLQCAHLVPKIQAGNTQPDRHGGTQIWRSLSSRHKSLFLLSSRRPSRNTMNTS